VFLALDGGMAQPLAFSCPAESGGNGKAAEVADLGGRGQWLPPVEARRKDEMTRGQGMPCPYGTLSGRWRCGRRASPSRPIAGRWAVGGRKGRPYKDATDARKGRPCVETGGGFGYNESLK
jgi:hypothetical protein